jgi:tetratricopeptide (TPR) repeat protein
VSVSIGDAVLRFFIASLAEEQFRLEFGDRHVTAHVYFYGSLHWTSELSRKKTKSLPSKVEKPSLGKIGWLITLGALGAGVYLLIVFLWPFFGIGRSATSGDSLSTGRNFNFDEPFEAKPSIELPTDATYEGRAIEQARLLESIAKVASEYPDSHLVYHIAGIAFTEASQFEKAIENLEKSVALDSKQVEPVLMLADAYVKSGKQEKAIEILNQALMNGLASASLFLALGDTFAQLGRTDDAIQNLEKSRDLEAKNVKTYRYLAQAYVDAGRFPEAEQAAAAAIRLGAGEASIYTLWALSLARQGKTEESKKVRSQTPKREDPPEQDQDILEKSFLEATSHHYAMLGNVCAANKSFEQAESYLLQALKLDPKSVISTGLLADLLQRQGKSSDCLVVSKRLIELEPDHVVHYWNLANLAMSARNVTLAEKTLLQATEIDSTGTSDLLMAQLLMNLRKSENLVKYARQAVDRLGTVEAYVVLISALQATGESNAAQLELLKARKLAPNDPRLAG